jgi:hypothetical protein
MSVSSDDDEYGDDYEDDYSDGSDHEQVTSIDMYL